MVYTIDSIELQIILAEKWIFQKRISVEGLDNAERRKILEEFRLLSCMRDMNIVK